MRVRPTNSPQAIKFSLLGQEPYWWEDLDYSNLQVFNNPSYISSEGENKAWVSGEIGNKVVGRRGK